MLGEMAHASYCFYYKNKNITKDMTKVVKKMCLGYLTVSESSILPR